MGTYALRRAAQACGVFLGITMLIYAFVYLIPGDPIKALSPGRPLPANVVVTLRERYNLNDPAWEQYLKYLKGLLHGNLGTDFYGRSVAGLMGERWPITLRLAGTAWLFEIIFGIGLGVWSATRRNCISDRVILLVGVGLISVPAFVLALAGQLLFGVKAGLVPIAGIEDGWPRSYLLPAVVLASFGLASVSRLVRSSVIENLRADYVRTAYAKGLTTRRVVLRHILRNSLVAAVTYLALDLGYLLGGTVVVEGIFNLPGIGQLLFTSIQQKNGPTVVGIGTLLVMVFLVLNLAVDLLYGVLDPRIRHDQR